MGGARPGAPATSRGIALKGSFGGEDEHADVAGDRRSTPTPTTTARCRRRWPGALGLLAASRVAAADAPNPTHPLVVGYARALEVIAREWRVGEGPAGRDAARRRHGGAARRCSRPCARTATRWAPTARRARRASCSRDPGVAATVLYRLAQSKTVGRKIAPDAVYAPFVKDRVPEGISPAAVLGPFRNFQAKLLSAWARAVLEGNPPRDIADLVDAYGRALPAERSEIIRIFVVTTFGATVKPGGVRPPAGNPGAALPELTALAAEVAAGKLSVARRADAADAALTAAERSAPAERSRGRLPALQ